MRHFPVRIGKGHVPQLALIAVMALLAGALLIRGSAEPGSFAPIRTGREVVLVFIASSSCPGAKDPRLPEALADIQNHLRREAGEQGSTFVSIGVSLDWDIEKGIKLLRRFGAFDEIAVGRSWMNGAALKYIWEDLPGAASIPQVLLVERTVTQDRAIFVGGERVRFRKVGAEAIVRWSQLAFGENR
jgi:hypothetical protein